MSVVPDVIVERHFEQVFIELSLAFAEVENGNQTNSR
jgi:hypothetical protein